MASDLDELEDGLELVLKEHKRLAKLSPNHELLKYGDVKPEDRAFYINDQYREEFNKRFAKDGIHPRGARACAYAVARYLGALNKAADGIEVMRKLQEGLVKVVSNVPDKKAILDTGFPLGDPGVYDDEIPF